MKRSQFGKEEEGCGYGVFAAPAETEWSWLLLTRWRHGLQFRFQKPAFFSWKIETVLFFLSRRKKRMGSKKKTGDQWSPLRSLAGSAIKFVVAGIACPTIPQSPSTANACGHSEARHVIHSRAPASRPFTHGSLRADRVVRPYIQSRWCSGEEWGRIHANFTNGALLSSVKVLI